MDAIVSRTLSVHNEHELLLKLEAAGLDDVLAQRVISSKGNDLAGKVVRLIQNGGLEPSVSQKRAREIMGQDYFGVEEAIAHFGVNPSRQQLAALAEVPDTEEVLEAMKATHIYVAVFPLSILDIRGKVERPLFYDHEDAWYNKQAFAKDRGEVGWYLVKKTPVPNSTSKNWQEQQALLGKDEETPTARIMTYTVIGRFKATGERLFERIYVRCSDVDSDGDHVSVGNFFSSEGLLVNSDGDDDRFDNLGLSSARKFN